MDYLTVTHLNHKFSDPRAGQESDMGNALEGCGGCVHGRVCGCGVCRMSLILTLAQLLHSCALVSFLDANARTVHDGNSDATQQQCLSSRGSSCRSSLETTIRRTCGKPRLRSDWVGEPALILGPALEYFVYVMPLRLQHVDLVLVPIWMPIIASSVAALSSERADRML